MNSVYTALGGQIRHENILNSYSVGFIDDKMLSLICLIFVFGHFAANTQQTCNGMTGLCRLKIYEVTLAGTHNSGAGFDGHLKYGTGALALSCFYRNQGKSITGQLDLGIR